MYDKKILIAEDEVEIAAALEDFLREEGFTKIDRAVDGAQIARKSKKFKPDLILFDIQMPGWDGFSALMRLKLSIPTADIPFIVITGLCAEELKEQFMAEGARAYFYKPFNPEILVETIKKVFSETDQPTKLIT